MAFERIINIYVGNSVESDTPGSDSTLQLTGRDPGTGWQGLDCHVKCHRQNKMAGNQATVEIFNLDPETRKFLTKPGMLIRVDAGYLDDGVGTIFIGQIDSADSEPSGAEIVTKIEARHFRSINIGYEDMHIALSYQDGTLLSTVIVAVADLLGVVPLGTENANICLDGGWTYVGNMKGALLYIANCLRYSGLSFFYDLAQMVVFRSGTATTSFEEVILSLGTTLLKAEIDMNAAREERAEIQSENTIKRRRQAYDKAKSADGKTRAAQSILKAQEKAAEAKRKRVKFSALCNPRIRPNCPITITDHPSANGSYVLDVAEYDLSTDGGDFVCNCEASSDG